MTMKMAPRITAFVDDEEKELVKAIEASDYDPGASALSSTRLAELKAAARQTIADERTKISLRVPKSDLARIKARALREGVPYQALINSILHKAVTG